MSGQQGNPPQGPPGRTLVSLLLAEPAVGADRRLAPWLGQFLQRLAAYVGASDGSGTTITNQVINVSNALLRELGSGGADASSLERLAELEAIIGRLPPPYPPIPVDERVPGLPAPPAASEAALAGLVPPLQECCPGVPPIAPLMPWLTDADIVPPTPVTAIYAPLVNGDLPGPTLVANGAGACIMVPIT